MTNNFCESLTFPEHQFEQYRFRPWVGILTTEITQCHLGHPQRQFYQVAPGDFYLDQLFQLVTVLSSSNLNFEINSPFQVILGILGSFEAVEIISLTGHFINAIRVKCVDHNILIDWNSVAFLAFFQFILDQVGSNKVKFGSKGKVKRCSLR